MSDERQSELESPQDDRQTLRQALAAENAQPLWERYRELLTKEPPLLGPLLWPWAKMGHLVERAAREVSMPEAERRVLLLVHPVFAETAFTTSTLSAGLQILNPGESAPPHRHTIAALRLIMMGEGAETITDGKVCPMEAGDLILTPAWTWHAHRHNGRRRMVWFDGLDYPLTRNLGTMFLEGGQVPNPTPDSATVPDATLGEGGLLPEDHENNKAYSPLFRYAWSRVQSVLESIEPARDGSKRVRYVNPLDGGAIMPTIDCFAHRLASGVPTRRMRATSTAIAVVIEGEGVTSIGEKVLNWRQHDVFTLPRWQWITHTAHAAPATLFVMTDRALLQRIGHLREEILEAA
jgi:gentisate 1,2-dioxygenase